jgi:hypothetical protein
MQFGGFLLIEDYLVFRLNNLDDHVSNALLRQNLVAIVPSVSEVKMVTNL